jgi:hypothetical protein
MSLEKAGQAIALLGFVGVVVFGGLFQAYYEFYSGVGLSPEDGGVDYAFVLARSIGLGALLVAGMAYFAFIFGLSGSLPYGRERDTRYARLAIWRCALLLIVGVASILFLRNYSGIYAPVRGGEITIRALGLGAILFSFGITFIIAGFMDLILVVRSARGLRKPERGIVFIIFAVSLLVGIPAGLSYYAGGLADQARSGYEVAAPRILGIPLLDVQAEWVDIQWVGPPGQVSKYLSARRPLRPISRARLREHLCVRFAEPSAESYTSASATTCSERCCP